jgi:hypothetical protein
VDSLKELATVLAAADLQLVAEEVEYLTPAVAAVDQEKVVQEAEALVL